MKEPKHTCPMIDSVIDTIKQIQKDIEYYLRGEEIFDKEDFITALNDANKSLDNIPGEMENIRDNTLAIREWGSDYKNQYENLEYDTKKELEEKDYIIEDLKEQIERQS